MPGRRGQRVWRAVLQVSPLSRLRRQLPLKGEPFGRPVPQWAQCRRDSAVVGADIIRPPGRLRRAVKKDVIQRAQSARGIVPEWGNLAGYGKPIACQRQNRPVTLSLSKGLADCGMVSSISSAGIRRKTIAIGKIPRRFAALNDIFFCAGN